MSFIEKANIMEYFYIACSIASFIGFVISLYSIYSQRKTKIYFKYFLVLFIAITIAFWIWFYFAPRVTPQKIISERLLKINTYTDGKEIIDIIEGEIDFRNLGPKGIFFPPFKDKPIIEFISISNMPTSDPTVLELTTNKLIAKVGNTTQLGKWKYRLRGELLRKVN
jgi:hypothetical protein